MNIGIFGGSFDPIHEAHLHIAQCFAEQCNLDKCLFIPANISPFKLNNTDAMFTAEQRMAMIEEAVAGNNHFEICDYELKNTEISYTIDTLNFVKNKYMNLNLFLLIGTDQAIEFNKWKDYRGILEMAQLVIAKRVGSCTNNEKKIINSILYPHIPIWLNHNMMPISSTAIRNQIRNKNG